MKKIVFFGTEDFSLTALKGLVGAGFEIAAVITKPDSKRGRKQLITPPAVKIYAEQHGIPVIQPEKLKNHIEEIKQLGDNIGVLVSYGKIIPNEIIELFSPGIINVHPSLLPKYRGPSPIESAIAKGDEITGVSVMKLVATMDAGPIYKQVEYQLVGNETKPELYGTLAQLGTKTLINVLPSISDSSLNPAEQDEAQATYCQLLNKKDGLIVPSEITAPEAERLVRAYVGFPKTKAIVENTEIIVTKSHVASDDSNPITIRCKDDTLLSIDELVSPNGKTMLATSYINGRSNN